MKVEQLLFPSSIMLLLCYEFPKGPQFKRIQPVKSRSRRRHRRVVRLAIWCFILDRWYLLQQIRVVYYRRYDTNILSEGFRFYIYRLYSITPRSRTRQWCYYHTYCPLLFHFFRFYLFIAKGTGETFLLLLLFRRNKGYQCLLLQYIYFF